MARERCPNERKSSGSNQRALRRDSLVFLDIVLGTRLNSPILMPDMKERVYLHLFSGSQLITLAFNTNRDIYSQGSINDWAFLLYYVH